jgi:hypothetical protein
VKARRKETTRRPRHREVTTIKMGLREIEWGVMGWIHLAQDMDHGGLL